MPKSTELLAAQASRTAIRWDDTEQRWAFKSDPEAYGLDINKFTRHQQTTWDMQERFLARYAGYGTKTSTALAIGIDPSTLHKWTAQNTLGFADRLAHAQAYCIDTAEEHLLENGLASGPKDNPTWLLAWLNANAPDKYRQSGAGASAEDTAKALLGELAKLKQAEADSPKADTPGDRSAQALPLPPALESQEQQKA